MDYILNPTVDGLALDICQAGNIDCSPRNSDAS